MDGSRDATIDVHPLFRNADPAYRTPREPQVTERAHTTTHQDEFDSSQAEEEGSTGGIPPPRQAAQGSWPPNLESRRSPFRQVPPPWNLYQAASNAPPPRIGTVWQHMDDSHRMGPLDNDGRYDDNDASLEGMIISPWNAD